MHPKAASRAVQRAVARAGLEPVSRLIATSTLHTGPKPELKSFANDKEEAAFLVHRIRDLATDVPYSASTASSIASCSSRCERMRLSVHEGSLSALYVLVRPCWVSTQAPGETGAARGASEVEAKRLMSGRIKACAHQGDIS
jgi:hypothetical protein